MIGAERKTVYVWLFVSELRKEGADLSLVTEVRQSVSSLSWRQISFGCLRPAIFECTHLNSENPIEQTVQLGSPHLPLN